MAVKSPITEKDGVYFFTFTCCHWLPLIQQTNSFDTVYKWFDYLKSKGHYIIGYVIMPNHLHALIAFHHSDKTITTLISNGKRFIAYEIVKRLQKTGNKETLERLADSVTNSDKKRGKLHQVFEPSFDWKECRNNKFIKQKLDYIHDNPCKGVWNLAMNAIDYPHSSAKYYQTGEQGIYAITSYTYLEDIDLTK
jgi:REP element-mobilizing transposase RayT